MMAARVRFAVCMGLSMCMACAMCNSMHVYARVMSNVRIHVMRGSVSGAMSEISQQRRYDEVYQPDQEAANKHK